MTTLDLTVIRTDGGTQPRAEIDMVTVAEYADDMTREAQFPPVVVFFDGSAYWLADGFHRYRAALSIGLTEIDAEVKQGTLAEAQWYSYSVNQSHGLRRTNEDKRRAVEAALSHPFAGRYSDNEIARHCGVSQPFVSKLRPSYNDYKIERTVTRNGTTYPMDVTNIGRRETEPPPMVWHVAPEAPDDDESLNGCHNCRHLQTHGDTWWCTKLERPTYLENIICDMEHWQSDDEETTTPATPPHVSYNSGNNEWYTPAQYADAARRVMGGIDLDPASTSIANEVIQATTFYTVDEDGLKHEWSGRVWMNPPYASELIGQFADKLAASDEVTEAIVLVNNATETRWFRQMVDVASAVCFPTGRVRFWSADRESATPLQGQAIIYIGQNVERFRTEFATIGWSAVL